MRALLLTLLNLAAIANVISVDGYEFKKDHNNNLNLEFANEYESKIVVDSITLEKKLCRKIKGLYKKELRFRDVSKMDAKEFAQIRREILEPFTLSGETNSYELGKNKVVIYPYGERFASVGFLKRLALSVNVNPESVLSRINNQVSFNESFFDVEVKNSAILKLFPESYLNVYLKRFDEDYFYARTADDLKIGKVQFDTSLFELACDIAEKDVELAFNVSGKHFSQTVVTDWIKSEDVESYGNKLKKLNELTSPKNMFEAGFKTAEMMKGERALFKGDILNRFGEKGRLDFYRSFFEQNGKFGFNDLTPSFIESVVRKYSDKKVTPGMGIKFKTIINKVEIGEVSYEF